MFERDHVCLLRHCAKNIASHSTVQMHGAEVWVKVSRDMRNIRLKFSGTQRKKQKEKKSDLNQGRSVGTSSSVKLNLLVRCRAPFVYISVLNPRDLRL